MWFQGLDVAPDYLKYQPARWRSLNPGYQILEWDYVKLTEFIRLHYPLFYERWNALPSVIKKCDMARLLVIHHYGGFYFDLDLIPQIPLERWLCSREIRHAKTCYVRTLPKPDPVDPCDYSRFDIILCREHRPIDTDGFGIANGVLIAKPGQRLFVDFVNEQIDRTEELVLDYMGTWAFTRFVRSRISSLTGVAKVVPPFYFLWEDFNFDEPAPAWCVTKHLAKNTWGDHSKPDWWRV